MFFCFLFVSFCCFTYKYIYIYTYMYVHIHIALWSINICLYIFIRLPLVATCLVFCVCVTIYTFTESLEHLSISTATVSLLAMGYSSRSRLFSAQNEPLCERAGSAFNRVGFFLKPSPFPFAGLRIIIHGRIPALTTMQGFVHDHIYSFYCFTHSARPNLSQALGV